MTDPKPTRPRQTRTVDPAEVERFDTLAEEWWDPFGQFRPLHSLNPVRLAFIRDSVAAHFDRDPVGPTPLIGLNIVDIGCGGGLVTEPLARLGGRIVGIDASAESIDAARIHAAETGIDIDYRRATAEDLASDGEKFDVVVSMEVIEHVTNADDFLQLCCNLVTPGGALVLATLNRTAKAFAYAIIGAEYLLRWLPQGTHDWRKFVRPSEMAGALRRSGAEVHALRGVSYNPLTDSWALTRDLTVNYMAYAVKVAGP